MKRLFNVIACTLTASIIGCGSGSDEEIRRDQETYLRLINAVPDVRSVDLLINSESYYTGVGFLQSPGYFRIDTDRPDIRVVVSGSFATLFDSQSSLDDEADQTLIVYGTANEPRTLITKDDNELPGGDVAKVRMINLSTSTRNVDAYLTLPNRPLVVPTGDDLGFGAMSEYFVSDSGAYVLTVTDNDSTNSLGGRKNVTLEDNGVYTILIADTAPGSLPIQTIVVRDR